jgi:hypothetical protein
VFAVGGNGQSGTLDNVNGSGANITLRASSNLAVTGSTDTVSMGAYSNLSISGFTDAITATTGDKITVQSGTGETITGSHVTVNGGNSAGFTIVGTADVVYAGLNDAINDGGSSTTFKINSNVGNLAISGFGADTSGIIDLLNGAGGYTSASQAFAALTSDGAGGSKLSLGADGSIDFAHVAPSSLHTAISKSGDRALFESGSASVNDATIRPAIVEGSERLDPGLAALSLVAGYYRIAADPAQMRHQLALTGRLAGAEDLLRAANLLHLKSRVIRGVDAMRLGALPYPAILELKDGGFAILAVSAEKGNVRLADPVLRTAKEVSLGEAEALSSGSVILVTRRLGGTGIDPNSFGFRWFWPSILRYRRPLAHVVVASLFVQLFALASPIFFQLVVDKVLVHKGMSTLVVLIVGMVVLGLFETILQFLRAYTLSHTTNRIDVELGRRLFHHLAGRLFRNAGSRPDRRTRAGVGDDPQFSDRARPHFAARSRLHPRLRRGHVHLFGEAYACAAPLGPCLCCDRRRSSPGPATANQREVQPRRALAAVPGRIDRRRADAEGGRGRADDAGAMGGAAGLLRPHLL